MDGATASLRIGSYELLRRIGSGGMAEVFLARRIGEVGFRKTVVLKRILPNLGREPEFVRMFIDEAKLSSYLQHPNIVQVYDLGRTTDQLFIVMEYVAGKDLARLLRTTSSQDRPLEPPLVAHIVRDLARALRYAHELTDDSGKPLRIIHRDVTPSNVLIGFDGVVKLLDFGIAKAADGVREEQTRSGTLKGKFAYMAPEQIEGHPADQRGDVFSLGVVLWEMLCARRLFKGHNDANTVMRVKQGPIPKPSSIREGVPGALDAVALNALARDPAQRFQRAADMVRALDEALLGVLIGPDDVRAKMAEMWPEGAPKLSEMGVAPSEVSSGALAIELASAAAERRDPTGVPDTDPNAGTLTRAPVTRSELPLAKPRSGRRVWAMVVAGVIAAVATGGVLVLRGDGGDEAVEAGAGSEAMEALPDDVKVEVRSTPGAAEVWVGDAEEPAGETPVTIELSRDDEPVTLVLRRAGYSDLTVDVTPDKDDRIFLALAEVPATAAPVTATATPAPVAAKTGKKGSRPRVGRGKPGPDPKTGKKPRGADVKKGDVVDPFKFGGGK